jgi:hypothetical protein
MAESVSLRTTLFWSLGFRVPGCMMIDERQGAGQDNAEEANGAGDQSEVFRAWVLGFRGFVYLMKDKVQRKPTAPVMRKKEDEMMIM